MAGWIGVDLDGTLAHYGGWVGPDYIGAPIPAMVVRVRQWLAEGREVRIVTARVAQCGRVSEESGLLDGVEFAEAQRRLIGDWCERHLGARLEVTASKDFGMVELYDDRAVQVQTNTGRVREGGWWSENLADRVASQRLRAAAVCAPRGADRGDRAGGVARTGAAGVVNKPQCARCQDQGLVPAGNGADWPTEACDCTEGDAVRAMRLVERLHSDVAEVHLSGNGTQAGNACLAEFANVRAAGFRHAAELLDRFRAQVAPHAYSDGEKAGMVYAAVFLRELAAKAERGGEAVSAVVRRKERIP